ncbi:LuxR C-terminal-related transcriptional regulator [Nocardia sp. SSK8]|uniref:LuxR C-terminal-related transcriptional regulator n=1 Tax=Nocardia sp. SSK8 TaxID=3120154 RepID=UPI00300B7BE2
MSPIALDSLPNAREILRSIDAAPQKPVVLLLSGRSGTGKSVLLDAARQRLRGRGLGVIGSVPVPPTGGAVVVLDDLHTLTPAQLDALSAEIAAGTRSFLCAMQPRPQVPALRALCETVARHGRTVELRTLGSGDIAALARELGVTVPRPIIQHIHAETAGVPGGVVAALLAAGAARLDQGIAAVDDALAVWTRSQLSGADPALLDTLVVAATGTGLDAGELAEVLEIEPQLARDLLVRARTSALVTDADLLLSAAVPQLRVLLGDRRYMAVQHRLLDTRLAAGLLRDHTGLLLAESGVRDERLAEFLCRAAEHNRLEAARYYAAAAAAGADPHLIALPWAEAAATAGDDDTALRLAEPILDRPDASPTDLAAAVRLCATVLTRRGTVHRAAALYRWLGPHRVGADWATATTVLALAGDTTAATDAATDADRWPPTESTASQRLTARTLLTSLGTHLPGVTPTSSPVAGGRATAEPTPTRHTEHAAPNSPDHSPHNTAGLLTPHPPGIPAAVPGERLGGASSVGPETIRPGTVGGLAPRTPATDDRSPSGQPATDPIPAEHPTAKPRHADHAAAISPGHSSTGAPSVNPEAARGRESHGPVAEGRSPSAQLAIELTQALHTDRGRGPCTAITVATLLHLSAGDSTRAAAAICAATGWHAGDEPTVARPGTTDEHPHAPGRSAPDWANTRDAGTAPLAGSGNRRIEGSSDNQQHRATSGAGSHDVAHDSTGNPHVPGSTDNSRDRALPILPPLTALTDHHHAILAAWVALATGDEQRAAEILASLGHVALSPRDRLLAHALAVGLARRGGDAGALRRAWMVALPAFDKVDIDLLSLGAVGELWLAGIVVRDEGRVQGMVEGAAELVRGLGSGSVWAVGFHWYGVLAALAGDAPQRLLPHAHALKDAAAAGDAHAAVLADAGRTWLLVRRGEADIEAVRGVVLALAEWGHAYDGAHLAEDTARLVEDPAVGAALRELADSVRVPAHLDQPVTSTDASQAEPRPLVRPQALSEREREVAELVLLGLTYREIGARLYISAKTVEHHVARIRRRIGARSRSELLSMLRAMGHGSLLV